MELTPPERVIHLLLDPTVLHLLILFLFALDRLELLGLLKVLVVFILLELLLKYIYI
jgi:hypothetical protein